MKQAHENTHHLTPPAACCHRSAESNLPPSIEGLALPPQIPRRSTTSLLEANDGSSIVKLGECHFHSCLIYLNFFF
jgi:hypothetical protein